MHKGFLHFGVLAILGLICLLVAASLIFNTELLKDVKKQMMPEPSPSPSASPKTESGEESANWKTYTNEKQGYMVKYPNEQYWSQDNENEITGQGFNDYYPNLIIYFDSEPSSLSLADYAKKRSMDYKNSNFKIENILIDNKNGIRVSSEDEDGFSKLANNCYWIFVANNNKIYEIGSAIPGIGGGICDFSDSQTKKDLKVFDQILSTFQFID